MPCDCLILLAVVSYYCLYPLYMLIHISSYKYIKLVFPDSLAAQYRSVTGHLQISCIHVRLGLRVSNVKASIVFLTMLVVIVISSSPSSQLLSVLT